VRLVAGEVEKASLYEVGAVAPGTCAGRPQWSDGFKWSAGRLRTWSVNSRLRRLKKTQPKKSSDCNQSPRGVWASTPISRSWPTVCARGGPSRLTLSETVLQVNVSLQRFPRETGNERGPVPRPGIPRSQHVKVWRESEPTTAIERHNCRGLAAPCPCRGAAMLPMPRGGVRVGDIPDG